MIETGRYQLSFEESDIELWSSNQVLTETSYYIDHTIHFEHGYAIHRQYGTSLVRYTDHTTHTCTKRFLLSWVTLTARVLLRGHDLGFRVGHQMENAWSRI